MLPDTRDSQEKNWEHNFLHINKAQIAIETQWVDQTIEETKRCQEKYIASGIRAVCFIRTPQKNKWDFMS
ncbi:hypothetical protein [Acinetobacter sp. A3]|uniref:hypothetical protein n=1 Tax=unclassified Acinetobacter TaxID=196816 RepID=UPI00144762B0|nr:hypothetical protein [Acinetobacter sp. A3]